MIWLVKSHNEAVYRSTWKMFWMMKYLVLTIKDPKDKRWRDYPMIADQTELLLPLYKKFIKP